MLRSLPRGLSTVSGTADYEAVDWVLHEKVAGYCSNWFVGWPTWRFSWLQADCMYVLAKLSDFRNLMVFIEFISWVLSFYLLLWRTYERAILLQGSWTVLEGPIWWSSEWGIFEDRGEHCVKRSRMTSTAYVQLSKWELFRTGLFSATTWRCEDYMCCLFFIKKFNTVCFASGIHWIYYGGPGRL